MTTPHPSAANLPGNLNPGGLVRRLHARCGATLVPLAPLVSFDPLDVDLDLDLDVLADIATEHIAQCACGVAYLLINDGDNGHLVAYTVVDQDGSVTHVAPGAML